MQDDIAILILSQHLTSLYLISLGSDNVSQVVHCQLLDVLHLESPSLFFLFIR